MKKTSRLRKTSQKNDYAIRQAVMQSPTSSCQKIRVNLLKNGTNINISTISCCLNKEFSLKSYTPAAKLRLTSAIKKKRLFFANKQFH